MIRGARLSLSCNGLLRVFLLGLVALVFAPAALAQEAPADPAAQSLLLTTEQWLGDLDGMRKRRQIRLLVPYSKTFYFVDKGGKQFGITYDVGHAFEEWLNKREKTKTLKIAVVFIPVARDRLLSGLVDGLGDIAAGNITITEQRAEIVQFGDPFAKDIKEVLVTGPTAAPIATLDDLAGREIHVRRSSSYFEHLQSLSSALEAKGLKAIVISDLDDELEDEDIMEMVNAGLLPWAVVDEHKAILWTAVLTKLTVRSDLAINQGGEIAWAMRKDNPQLLEVVNEFTKTHKIGTTFGNMLKKRHLGSDSFVKRSTSTEELEKFEAIGQLFKTYGQQYDFDWLMIAAQGYQESKLDQSARSPRGAVGVMQLMPKTAADPDGRHPRHRKRRQQHPCRREIPAHPGRQVSRRPGPGSQEPDPDGVRRLQCRPRQSQEVPQAGGGFGPRPERLVPQCRARGRRDRGLRDRAIRREHLQILRGLSARERTH